jgi:hypothetical protein
MRLRTRFLKRLRGWEMTKLDPIAYILDNHADLAGGFDQRKYSSRSRCGVTWLLRPITVER